METSAKNDLEGLKEEFKDEYHDKQAEIDSLTSALADKNVATAHLWKKIAEERLESRFKLQKAGRQLSTLQRDAQLEISRHR